MAVDLIKSKANFPQRRENKRCLHTRGTESDKIMSGLCIDLSFIILSRKITYRFYPEPTFSLKYHSCFIKWNAISQLDANELI